MEKMFEELKKVTKKSYPKKLYLGGEDHKITKDDLNLYYNCLMVYKNKEAEYQVSQRRLKFIPELQEMQVILEEFSTRLLSDLKNDKETYKFKTNQDFADWQKILEILKDIFAQEDLSLKYLSIYSVTSGKNNKEYQNNWAKVGIISAKNILNLYDENRVYSTADIIDLLRKLYINTPTLVLASNYERMNMIIPVVWPNPKGVIAAKNPILGYKLTFAQAQIMASLQFLLQDNNYDLNGLNNESIVSSLKQAKRVREKEA